jgi:hypothetical protein
MEPQAELAKLQKVYAAAELWDEGGQPLVFIPGLCIRSGRAVIQTDAVLCPRQHSSAGYPTRLFLRQQIPNRGQNWAQHVIRGISGWFSPSYDRVPASLPWMEILAAHLRGYA